jgi:2-amino-4-hydroxy-6-hydroxymethyldihydropteridine diphosphokinase
VIEVLTTKEFPIKQKRDNSYKYEALIGIGGNIGDVLKRFKKLFYYWQKHPQLKILQTSPLLKNPAFGEVKQDDFLNAVALIQTSLSAQHLLKHLLHTEGRFGRVRTIPKGPRTLDLDMIFYEDKNLSSKHLTLPHPGWKYRTSVLVPLALMQQRIK